MPAPGPRRPLLSRRRLLQAAGAAAAGTALGRPLPVRSAAAAAPEAPLGGRVAVRHAMHVHSSFSEGFASLQAQLSEAAANGIDVLWTTDHDTTMSAARAPDAFHFSGTPEQVLGLPYQFRTSRSGALSESSAGLVRTPPPADLSPGAGALRVSARSAGSAVATCRSTLDASRAGYAHRANLAGQTLAVQVCPLEVGPDAWGELRLVLATRPAGNGRPSGRTSITYRFGSLPAARTAKGLTGVVQVPLRTGDWSEVLLDPVADAAALWPDLVPSDGTSADLSLGATSRRRAPATVLFGWLRLQRSRTSGDEPLQAQRELIAAYEGRWPGLLVRQGLEITTPGGHVNAFSEVLHLLDPHAPPADDPVAHAAAAVHADGGVAALNHPLGAGTGGPASRAAQDARRRQVAGALLARAVGGVDVVEAGYRCRQGGDLETHLALVDTLWRAGRWVTASGANDNHYGRPGSWASDVNRFTTTLWQRGGELADALAALREGQAYVGELGGFAGALDLSADGTPMGGVAVRPGVPVASLDITATDLPAGSTVEVVQGPVDLVDAVEPGTSVVASLPASSFAGGTSGVLLDTTTSCFARVAVVTAEGRRVAFSNPVFLLQDEPPADRAVPQARRAAPL